MKYFYEKNTELLESSVNKTFDEVLMMSDDEFRQWVIDLRKTVVDLWDNKGVPPRVGYDEDEIIENFRKMIGFPVQELEVAPNVIRNTSVIGNAVNQWFPTMMKTKISYTAKGEARSIYDYFAEDNLLDTFITYASRHFKRDSFYHYSTPISVGDQLSLGGAPHTVSTPEAFRDWFKTEAVGYGYWLCGVKDDKKYTGYNTSLGAKENLYVDDTFQCPNECRTNVDPSRWSKYNIRLYKKGQRLFPVGLKAFRVSFCQYAVNFPPLTARYLYERYTKHIAGNDRVVIFDPSMGWGGRLVGALSIDSRRNIHYVGTDPNTDHDIRTGVTKYHDIADFFNGHIRYSGNLFPKAHTYEFFQKGSEVIGSDPEFQKYKGKLDLVFTSPPYFNKEVYSEDKEQSCHKFHTYQEWVNGFLFPTLQTCVEYLAKDRYLLWNIADIALDGTLLPLEKDSCRILTELGMQHVETLKMTLAQMPGGNRMVETGETEIIKTNTVLGEVEKEVPIVKGKMKNYIEVKSKAGKLMLKYEPIFVFMKT